MVNVEQLKYTNVWVWEGEKEEKEGREKYSKDYK